MPTPEIDIPDAVVDVINGATLSVPVTAERVYLPLYVLEDGDLDTLKVSVRLGGLDEAQFTRGEKRGEYTVEIGIQKKIASMGPTDVDPLVSLSKEIRDLWGPATASLGATGALWTGSRVVPYSDDHLRQHNVFSALIVLTFTLIQ